MDKAGQDKTKTVDTASPFAAVVVASSANKGHQALKCAENNNGGCLEMIKMAASF